MTVDQMPSEEHFCAVTGAQARWQFLSVSIEWSDPGCDLPAAIQQPSPGSDLPAAVIPAYSAADDNDLRIHPEVVSVWRSQFPCISIVHPPAEIPCGPGNDHGI
ncbi:hypothetical protein [Bacilliculturomica massiliensis]|uniref:hypothetical protein n=1 Tax=Bacilliculturomica massiliensis TaxID=1917867 RepID=UPI0010313C3B|nr:hypothetical protein [Bacilliculturomica massiliensis]